MKRSYKLRKIKPVNYSEDLSANDDWPSSLDGLASAEAVVVKRAKKNIIHDGEQPVIHLAECRIFNINGEMRRAQNVEMGEQLKLSGVREDGTAIVSLKLTEWCGLNIGMGKSAALGVGDGHNLFLMESPHAAYTDMFQESAATVRFASWLVDISETKAKVLTLEQLASTFFEKKKFTQMLPRSKSSKEFVKTNASYIANLLQSHWAGKFPKFPFIRELNMLRFGEQFQGSGIVASLFEDHLVKRLHLITKLDKPEKLMTLNSEVFTKFKGENSKVVCKQKDNISKASCLERYMEVVELKIDDTLVMCLQAGEFVHFNCNTGQFLIGQVNSINVYKSTAHIIQFHTALESLLGNVGNKWEIFATHYCADVPLAAILEKLQPVCLDGEPKEDQFFCRYEICTGFGWFQSYRVPEQSGKNCSECMMENQLDAAKEPTRIGKSDIVMFKGNKYKKDTFVRLERHMVRQNIEPKPASEPDKRWNQNKYKAERPELWRFTAQIGRSHEKPQYVAQITDIKFDADNKPTPSFKLFTRAEDTPKARGRHPNILLPEIEQKFSGKFRWEDIAGKAHVIYRNQVSNINAWLNEGPNRFFVETPLREKPPSKTVLPVICLSGEPASEYPKLPKAEKFKLLDLFCGAGIMTYGLWESGLVDVCWGVDSNKNCTDSFKANFPGASALNMTVNNFLQHLSEGDTEDEHGQALPTRGEVGMICGGSPCQGFSKLNKHLESGVSIHNRLAILSLLSVVELLDPKFVLVENVPSIAKFEDGLYIQIVLRCLLDLGYQCSVNIVQAAAFGVPQCRSRVIIIAAKIGQRLPEFPIATHCSSWSQNWSPVVLNNIKIDAMLMEQGAPFREVHATEAIGDLPHKAVSGCKYRGPPKNPFQAKMRSEGLKLSNHVVKSLSKLHEKRISCIPKGANWTHIRNIEFKLPDGTKTPTLKYIKKKKGKEVVCPCFVNEKCQKKTLKLKYKDSMIPFCMAHSADKNNNWGECFGRIPTQAVFSSITTSLHPMARQGRTVHHTANRLLSVREVARAQAIPDHFQFCGETSSMISQIGNGVPPPLAFQLGLAIVESILGLQQRDCRS